jgi:hypothetical protein
MLRLLTIGARYFLAYVGIKSIDDVVEAATPDQVTMEMDEGATKSIMQTGLFLFLIVVGLGVYGVTYYLRKRNKK